MNRTDRLVAMVMHLQGRRLVRGEELAHRFEISLRTVYRDISALVESGVPITGEAGVGYALVKGYHLPPAMLTADEAGALFVGGQLLRHFGDASLERPMEAALDKLRAVMPRERQDEVEQLARRTAVLGRPLRSPVEPVEHPCLLEVQRAVAQRRVLTLEYRSQGETAHLARTVEPLGVAFYRGAWYLIAWCRLRNDYRHFRVDRMRKPAITAEPVRERANFSLARHLKEQAARGGTATARLWLARAAHDRARAESFATLAFERERDGGAEFLVATFSLAWLARWILSFGPEAEALDPPDLRRLVREAAEAVARRHAIETLLT